MEVVQSFVAKLRTLDTAILGQLRQLALEYDRAHPGIQTPQGFEVAFAVFCRQRMPAASPQLHQLVRFYLVFHRFGGLGPTQQKALATMGPAVRSMYFQLYKDDPRQARAFLIQEMMASQKLMIEVLSNVSKTRSEISMTFARNVR